MGISLRQKKVVLKPFWCTEELLSSGCQVVQAPAEGLWLHFVCVTSPPPVVASPSFSPVMHDSLPALSFLEMEEGGR